MYARMTKYSRVRYANNAEGGEAAIEEEEEEEADEEENASVGLVVCVDDDSVGESQQPRRFCSRS